MEQGTTVEEIYAERELSASRFPIDELVAALESSNLVTVTASHATWVPVLADRIAVTSQRPLVVLVPAARRARVTREAIAALRTDADGVLLLPPLDVSPYNDVSPDRTLAMHRMETLAAVPAMQPGDVVVSCASAWITRGMPAESIATLSYAFEVDTDIDVAALRDALLDGGYAAEGLVEDPGTFSIRGDVIDIYSPAYERPVRIELYGDMVESIRYFDRESQRSAEDMLSFSFGPVCEELFTKSSIRTARTRIRELGDQLRIPSTRVGAVLRDIQNGVRFFGIEALRPAFYERLETVHERLPKNACVLVVDPDAIEHEVERLMDVRLAEYERARGEEALVFSPDEFFLTPDELQDSYGDSRIELRRVAAVDNDPIFDFPSLDNSDIVRIRKGSADAAAGLDAVLTRIEGWGDWYGRVALTSASRSAASRLITRVRSHGFEARLHEGPVDLSPATPPFSGIDVHVTPLDAGFRCPALGLAVLTEREVVGRARAVRSSKVAEDAIAVGSFKDLDVGDLVVHIDFGIGRYVGLQMLDAGAVKAEFLVIEYAGNDKLYLPVYRLSRVQKYVGSNSWTRIDKLGSTRWEQTKKRIKKTLQGVAEELLKLYAQRAARVGHAFAAPGDDFREFEDAFPFEETPHQQRAIDEVLADMTSPKPMDRLICGDVGFGKTEVAIRAAYKAALDGRQTAVLVPTTVLADQHLTSFRKRLADTAVKVDVVSRFRSTAEINSVLQDAAEGKVDIIIGTHRLLSKDIVFKDLGLLVIDEEQRFGVKHKERIKQLRASVDVLTMTATPIPRTLEMSLLGIRDLSVILTPPEGRLSVRTHIAAMKDNVIREGIEHELARNGQVFFVHNRVDSIYNFAEELRRIVPKARVRVGHAQMADGELEDVMHAFINREFDVLVSTTIIESGIDISTANTIFISRADSFGLSQLYQLRGRVGRGNQRGYCYLLANNPRSLSNDARRRLEVLQRHTELGSGLQIAHHDLDMRGAGNLLGRDQSGHVESIGFELFTELLEETIRELRGETASVDFEPDVRVPVAAFIPDAYVEDLKQRLLFYKRYSLADSESAVHQVHAEIQDRYGRAPAEVDALKEVVIIKLAMKEIRASRLDISSKQAVIELREDTNLKPAKVMELIEAYRGVYRFTPDMKVIRTLEGAEAKDPLGAAVRVLLELEECT